MSSKRAPIADEVLHRAAGQYPTPFHIYDEKTIREQCATLRKAFAWNQGFTNYFAAKATPNPYILRIVRDEGCGLDCSSLTELKLAEAISCGGEQIMFTSNTTPLRAYRKAVELGAIINLDDQSHIDFLDSSFWKFPSLISFRFNPGLERAGNVIIGSPADAKFGVTSSQFPDCYRRAKELGAKRFGAHTMIVSNCLKEDELVLTAEMMFRQALRLLNDHGIRLEFVNLGGGFGIPYTPDQKPLDVMEIGRRVESLYSDLILETALHPLKIFLECGRFVTGPAGVLVTRVIHRKLTYKNYVGVDASVANLMRPALYGAYHHIHVIKEKPGARVLSQLPKDRRVFASEGSEKADCVRCDIVGCLCENNDKLATDRELPADLAIGDLLVVHDTGAHGHAMGYNYNGFPRSAELIQTSSRLLSEPVFDLPKVVGSPSDRRILEIRRPETFEDLVATVSGRWRDQSPSYFPPDFQREA